MYTRSGDMVGRWGGDEFVVLLSSDAAGAASHMDRIREWVFGKYTIQRGANKDATVVHMDASLGLAEWIRRCIGIRIRAGRRPQLRNRRWRRGQRSGRPSCGAALILACSGSGSEIGWRY